MELLRSTVADLERRGSATYAAGVASRMKQVNPAFDVRGHGYKSFKDFLDQAAARGIVTVTRRAGASDLTVRSVDGVSAASGKTEPGRFLRQDLWAAITRLEAAPSWWQRDSGKLVGPMSDRPDDIGVWVELRPLTRDEVSSWMRDFARTVAEPEVVAGLVEALDTSSSVETFTSRVRANQGTARLWGRFYREHVMRRAYTWAEENAVPRSELFPTPVGAWQASASGYAKQAQEPSASAEDATTYERRVRAAVTSAVERMPLADLLRLQIPAEYLIRR